MRKRRVSMRKRRPMLRKRRYSRRRKMSLMKMIRPDGMYKEKISFIFPVMNTTTSIAWINIHWFLDGIVGSVNNVNFAYTSTD